MTEFRPGDGQAKIDAAPAGDTVKFTGGPINLPELTIRKRLIFTGDAPLMVRGQFYGFKMMPGSNGCQFLNLNADGTVIAVCDGEIADVVVDWCKFKCFNNGGAVYGQNSAGILHTHAIRNWRIRNTSFTDIGGLAAILGYHWISPIVEDCLFSTVQALTPDARPSGIKWDGKSGNVTDAIVRRNLFSGVRGLALEFQTRHIRTLIEDNYYEKPILKPGPWSDNESTFAFSCPWDDASTTLCIVRRNLFDCGDSAAIDGQGVRNLIELGGFNTVVEENYFKAGTSYWVGIDVTDNTTSGRIVNNWVAGSPKSGHNIRGNTGGYTQGGNTASKPVAFSWDVDRPKPGPGIPPPQPPDPTPIPPNPPDDVTQAEFDALAKRVGKLEEWQGKMKQANA